MKSSIFATTRMALPVTAFEWHNGPRHLMIIGGTHGDEIEGVSLAWGLWKEFTTSFTFPIRLTLVPEFNPEGVLLKQRANSAGVDLNRNLPTRDWTAKVLNPRYVPGPFANSEPENQALVQFLDRSSPLLILNLHSYHPCLNINGNCRREAEILSRRTGYSIVEDMGYPTPGCLGTYAGVERQSPTITYEIERGLPLDKVLKIHIPAVLEVIKYFSWEHS